MGAHNIDFEIEGKVTKKEILEKFQEIRIEERDCNGHQDGYSGDFQTIDTIKFEVLESGIGDYGADYELALNKSKKWDHGQAIYTKNNNGGDITLIVEWGAC